MIKHIKRAIRILLFLVAFGIMVLFWSDYHVGSFSKGRLFYNAKDVPHRPAALVLGTAKTVWGRPNLYYKYRIAAAVELWKANKIDAILVSGDNSRKDYDEPSAMKADLVEKGVPAEYITIDYAGFRTLDSVVRAERIFGLKEYVIVSQPFHCRRAIYLASRNGQSVIGYCAADVSGSSGIKVRLRESAARLKAVLDVLFLKKPKYLGPQEQVNFRIRE